MLGGAVLRDFGHYLELQSWRSKGRGCPIIAMEIMMCACLFQTIKAHVMLDRVCERKRQEQPELPTYTVHDSILVMEGNEWYVKQVMEQEFKRSMGAVPRLSVKLLCPDKLKLEIAQAA